MPNGNTSRSDAAPRAAELHAEKTATSIIEMARHIAKAEALHTRAERLASVRKNVAFQNVSTISFKVLTEAQYALLHLHPEGDDRDLMILAGLASAMADQLPDIVPETEDDATKLCEGIKAALRTISAYLSQTWPAGAESVDPIYPELARNIRQDVLVVNALRADAEEGAPHVRA